MDWSEERVDQLKQYWEQGLSASQIADSLGHNVTRNAVIGKAHRLQLPKRPSPIKRSMTTILDLTERMCRWPSGHPGEKNFHFCGSKVPVGVTYCAKHAAKAYQTSARKDSRRSRVISM